MPYRLLLLISLLAICHPSCQESLSPSWQAIPTPTTDDKLQALSFPNEQTGFAVGGLRFGQEKMLKTEDGGQSWQPLPDFFGQTWFDIHFLDSLQGYVCGQSGKLLRTADGGQQWRLVQLPRWLPMRAVFAVHDSLVFAVGGVAYDEGVITRSVDQGRSWELVDTPTVELRDITFVDDQRGFICGFGTIMSTEDGGNSWEISPIDGEFFCAIHFPSEQVGYAVGRTGSIVKTRDGGKTWERLRNGNRMVQAHHFYNDVIFWDESTGFISGDRGLLLYTEDGGESWQRLETDTKEDLLGLWLKGRHQGYVLGTLGSFFRFEI
jgi:photosystem II stability/assembly factor-like uncharacterized protein